ncbi:DinB family protein [Algoriphagus sp.]|uniref:DinB family protein n=1 Tax=Algoriphagus sp. TaxID=1872435 RepID=UPI00391CD654
MLSNSCSDQLEELSELLIQLSPLDYYQISSVFRTSSIGQHVRHILELFECLLTQYESGKINYDTRKRDLRLEKDPVFALEKIREIQSKINLSDKDLILFQDQNRESEGIKTTYFRELLYNLEHCVHHQALIRLACIAIPEVSIPENFGVAKSTIHYTSQLSSKN